MLKGKPLKFGDTIGLVGISGAIHEPETNFPRMIDSIEALGFKVIVADSCREQYGYPARISPAPTASIRCSATTAWTASSACAAATA